MLARHAPLVATLKAGSTRVHVGGERGPRVRDGPGFFKVELDARSRSSTTRSTSRRSTTPRAGSSSRRQGRAREGRGGRVDGRSLAARAAHPACREPAHRLGPHHRLSHARSLPGLACGAASACAIVRATRRALKAAWRPGHQTPKEPPRAPAGPLRRRGARPKETVSATDRLRAILDERIVVHDGAWGVLIHRRGLSEEEYRGERLARPRAATSRATPTSSTSRGPELVAEIHDAYFDGGRGHRDDEHVHGDVDRPGRLRRSRGSRPR